MLNYDYLLGLIGATSLATAGTDHSIDSSSMLLYWFKFASSGSIRTMLLRRFGPADTSMASSDSIYSIS